MKNKLDYKVQAFDYVQEAFSKYHNHQLYGCIKLGGMIRLNILEEAVNLTVNDLKELGCRYVKGEYRWSGERLKVEYINTKYLEEEIDKAMSKRNDIENGQQVRIVVIRNEEKDSIVIAMSHLLCDGMAIKEYMHLICKYYNDILNNRPIVFSSKEKKRDIGWVKDFRLPKNLKNRIKPKEEFISFPKGDINLFAKCHIDKRYYKKLQAYIKKKKVTMNDLFMAAFYKAVWEEFAYPLNSMACAVNLRRYIHNKEAVGLCNQTGNAFVTIEDSYKLGFEELLEKIHIQMENEKEQAFCLKQIKALEKAFRLMPHRISRRLIRMFISNPKAAITNVGKIDKDKVAFQGVETLDCRVLPSLKNTSNFQVIVCTFEKDIMIGVNMIVSQEGKEKINSFLHKYKKIIEEAVS